jgi:hypothetical protein
MALYSHFHSNLAGVIDTVDTEGERSECYKKKQRKNVRVNDTGEELVAVINENSGQCL